MATRAKHRNGARIERAESLYLDLIRALAAFAVVVDHAPTLFHMPLAPRLGHQAVVVFFVLSGYVISNTADTRETTARGFVVARLARLWSVLVPAMALTIACDVIGHAFGTQPGAYDTAPSDYPVVRVGAALTFLSECWVSIQPLSNGVIWSLCAEFWYYALFAAWSFAPPGSTRLLAIAAATALAGYKALLLPIWLMGAALQRSNAIRRGNRWTDMTLWVCGTSAAVVVTNLYDPAITAMREAVGPWVFAQLAQARVFWLDWVLGLAVAANFIAARRLAPSMHLERFAGPIRWCAGVSFAAYLFHMPLLHLLAAFLPVDRGWLAVGVTLAVIGVLGPYAERSKGWWRNNLQAATDRL